MQAGRWQGRMERKIRVLYGPILTCCLRLSRRDELPPKDVAQLVARLLDKKAPSHVDGAVHAKDGSLELRLGDSTR